MVEKGSGFNPEEAPKSLSEQLLEHRAKAEEELENAQESLTDGNEGALVSNLDQLSEHMEEINRLIWMREKMSIENRPYRDPWL